MLDQFYISIFNYYKKSQGKRSLNIALVYINSLEIALLLALCAFLRAFASQMKLALLSDLKFWILFTLITIFVVFKNWLRYTGKKRVLLNAKTKAPTTAISILWLLPLAALIIGLILLQA